MKPENIRGEDRIGKNRSVAVDETARNGQNDSGAVDEAAQAKRRKGAWESAVIATVWSLLSGGILLFLKIFYQVEGFWGAVLTIAAVMELVIIIPVWVLLKTRLKEIEGGEEDAAAKY